MNNFYLFHEDGKYKFKKRIPTRASKVIDINKIDAIQESKEFIFSKDGIQEERACKSNDLRSKKITI